MSEKEKDLTEEELAQATGGRKTRRTSEPLQETTQDVNEVEPEPTSGPTPTIKGAADIGQPKYW